MFEFGQVWKASISDTKRGTIFTYNVGLYIWPWLDLLVVRRRMATGHLQMHGHISGRDLGVHYTKHKIRGSELWLPIFKITPRPPLFHCQLMTWCRLGTGPSAGKIFIHFPFFLLFLICRNPFLYPSGCPLNLRGMLVKHFFY